MTWQDVLKLVVLLVTLTVLIVAAVLLVHYGTIGQESDRVLNEFNSILPRPTY